MSNLLLQKIVLLRVTEVGKNILKKKRPLLLAWSAVSNEYHFSKAANIHIFSHENVLEVTKVTVLCAMLPPNIALDR